jgi:hypothetical protein
MSMIRIRNILPGGFRMLLGAAAWLALAGSPLRDPQAFLVASDRNPPIPSAAGGDEERKAPAAAGRKETLGERLRREQAERAEAKRQAVARRLQERLAKKDKTKPSNTGLARDLDKRKLAARAAETNFWRQLRQETKEADPEANLGDLEDAQSWEGLGGEAKGEGFPADSIGLGGPYYIQQKAVLHILERHGTYAGLMDFPGTFDPPMDKPEAILAFLEKVLKGAPDRVALKSMGRPQVGGPAEVVAWYYQISGVGTTYSRAGDPSPTDWVVLILDWKATPKGDVYFVKTAYPCTASAVPASVPGHPAS